MYYLTDNPWPLVILLAAVAVAGFVMGQGLLRKLGLACAVAAGIVYVVSEVIVTPREEVAAAADSILAGFQKNDVDGIALHISSQSPELRGTAEKGLSLVEILQDFHIRSIQLKSESFDEIVVRIRANGSIRDRQHGVTQHVPEFWETTWIQESDAWKLAVATRLHPLSGEPRDTFERN